jgi:hypothetical protein
MINPGYSYLINVFGLALFIFMFITQAAFAHDPEWVHNIIFLFSICTGISLGTIIAFIVSSFIDKGEAGEVHQLFVLFFRVTSISFLLLSVIPIIFQYYL